MDRAAGYALDLGLCKFAGQHGNGLVGWGAEDYAKLLRLHVESQPQHRICLARTGVASQQVELTRFVGGFNPAQRRSLIRRETRPQRTVDDRNRFRQLRRSGNAATRSQLRRAEEHPLRCRLELRSLDLLRQRRAALLCRSTFGPESLISQTTLIERSGRFALDQRDEPESFLGLTAGTSD